MHLFKELKNPIKNPAIVKFVTPYMFNLTLLILIGTFISTCAYITYPLPMYIIFMCSLIALFTTFNKEQLKKYFISHRRLN